MMRWEWQECPHCGQMVGPVTTPAWRGAAKVMVTVQGPMMCSWKFIEEASRAIARSH